MVDLSQVARSLFVAGLASVVLSGCGEMVAKPYDGRVLRMDVIQSEEDFSDPGLYPRLAFGWSADNRVHKLRWVKLGGGRFSSSLSAVDMWLTALVPDQIPVLHYGDLIEVQDNAYLDTDFSTLNVPFVVRIICRFEDRTCINAYVAKHGRQDYIAEGAHYDMSQFTFTPKGSSTPIDLSFFRDKTKANTSDAGSAEQ